MNKDDLKLYIETIEPNKDDCIVVCLKYKDGNIRVRVDEAKRVYDTISMLYPNNKVIILPDRCGMELLNLDELTSIREMIDIIIKDKAVN